MSERELKLQAYLDNELGAEEAREVANWLARDQDAVALLHTLRVTRQALSKFEAGVRLPESREFYWSKIRRQIEQEEAPRPAPARTPWIVRLGRFLVPVSATALLVVAAFVVTRDGSWSSRPLAETAVADAKAFTYHDYAARTTLVWLSYPAE